MRHTDVQRFHTLVLPLLQRGLGGGLPGLGVPATPLLQVATAVPAVRVLAQTLASPVVDALGVSDGGAATGKDKHTHAEEVEYIAFIIMGVIASWGEAVCGWLESGSLESGVTN